MSATYDLHSPDPTAPDCPSWCVLHAGHRYSSTETLPPYREVRDHGGDPITAFGDDALSVSASEYRDEYGRVTLDDPSVCVYIETPEVDAAGLRRMAAGFMDAAHGLDEVRQVPYLRDGCPAWCVGYRSPQGCHGEHAGELVSIPASLGDDGQPARVTSYPIHSQVAGEAPGAVVHVDHGAPDAGRWAEAFLTVPELRQLVAAIQTTLGQLAAGTVTHD